MAQKNARIMSIILALASVGLIALGFLADVVGLGRDPSMLGRFQFLSIAAGMVLCVISVLFWLLAAPDRQG
jgi:uncharacterized membrane protein